MSFRDDAYPYDKTKAGIDISIYGAHSTRATAASAAINKGCNIEIMKSAIWTNCQTFERFFKLPVIKTGNTSVVLQHQTNISS